MLLGAWADPGPAASILDIGTGCGVLALMMAQKSPACIDAIDIHGPSAEEAEFNISQSPWAQRISVFCSGVEEHSRKGLTYDFIITNPPFFINSLKPASVGKLLAKHESGLTYSSLIESCLKMMHAGSSLCLILPVKEAGLFEEMAMNNGLNPRKKLIVRPVSSKPPHRMLIEFQLGNKIEITENELIIHDPANRFSTPYLNLTQNFHHFPKNEA